MDCQTESPDVLPGQTLPMFDPFHPGRNIPVSFHPDDLKGLREWVYAKRLEEMKTRKSALILYSAPWRIG